MKNKRSKKEIKKLMNFYGKETYELAKNMSPKSVMRWLAEVNLFLNKTIGIKKRLQNEAIARKIGW
jgi:hypothetical protein